MRRTIALSAALSLLMLLLLAPLASGCGEGAGGKVSEPGEYSGYSEPRYTGHETTSQYVTSFDGTRIAVDVHRPTGGPEEPLPAVLIMTPYHRASVKDDGEVIDVMSREDSPYRVISSYGYVIVVADIRGTGASFGTRYGIFAPDEVKDGDSLVNWIAEQPWCDGNVGMMGQSYLATIQFMNASNRNPHLKCIIPRYSYLDLYDFVYPGGILDFNFVQAYDMAMKVLNANQSYPLFDVYPSKPVDEDADKSLLAAATVEHQANSDLVTLADQMTFRDSTVDSPWGTPMGYPVASPSGHLREIEESGVAIYNMGGWRDCYVTATLSFQATLSNESKCLVGDYDHTQGFDRFAVECVRFFDRYLKGIENGIDTEPPYYVYTTGSEEWRAYEQWPPAGSEATPYYFGAGGSLSTSRPESEGADTYTVDYSTTSGEKTRWLAMTGKPSEYPDRAEEDAKCLTYTTAPLEEDLELTGHPVVHLFVSVSAADGDFFAYLEDVDESGRAQYKSEGQLRASMRRLEERPWLPELPYHPCARADAQPLTPGETVELVFDLFPASHLFKAGHSIRITLAGADRGNFRTPEVFPPPTWTVSVGGENASYVELPVVKER